MRSCHQYKEGICTKEEKGVSVVKGEERRGAWVYIGITKERVY